MRLIHHTTPQDILAAVKTFLLQAEIENCIMLGGALRMVDRPRKNDNDTYFATVEQNGKTIAAAQWTAPNFVHLSRGPQEAISLIVNDMHQRQFVPRGVSAAEDNARAFAEMWSAKTAMLLEQDYGLRMYQLEKVIAPRKVSGTLRLALPSDAPLAGEWALAFDKEVDFGSPEQIKFLVLSALEENGLYVWENNGPVSMLLRNAPTPNSERVSVVYTPPEHRGKGYGAAANAALAQIILDRGKRYACLFADINNRVSNQMYLNIGYQPVCDVHRYKFLEK
jgi:uncharacterized protein